MAGFFSLEAQTQTYAAVNPIDDFCTEVNTSSRYDGEDNTGQDHRHPPGIANRPQPAPPRSWPLGLWGMRPFGNGIAHHVGRLAHRGL